MKLYLHKLPLFLITGLFLFSACQKEYDTVEEMDEKSIQEYIKANNLVMKNELGVLYQIIKPGSGEDLKYTEVVPVIFTVKSLDGKYASVDTFSAKNRYGTAGGNSLYAGPVSNEFLGYFGREKRYPEDLKVAIVEILKKRGGEIRVIVPSGEAYGRNGFGDIPGNTSLDYTLKVLNEKEISGYDDQSINKYMQANNLSGFTKTSTGLYYRVENSGTGSNISIDSTITAEYTVKFFNGKVFDQATASNPGTFALNNVIAAWQQGIPNLIKGGGRIRLLAPSSLAYGFTGRRDDFGQVTIPTATCLDFDIKVTDVSITP